MNTIFPLSGLPGELTVPARGLYLAVTAAREIEKVTGLIVSLALRGPLRLVAGSEWIPGYDVARRLRFQTTEIETILGRVQLARAFTCYQLLDLLAAIRPGSAPVLVLDMLHTFYTDDIPVEVRRRVLEKCGQHLQRLSLSRPVAMLAQREASEDFPRFYTMLALLADDVYQIEAEEPAVSQMRLF
jgi:hypothetical protein